MPPLIDVDDVIDAHAVAEMLGLSQRNTVSLYQRRYPDMPRPVIDLGQGRCKLWLRSEVARWERERSKTAGQSEREVRKHKRQTLPERGVRHV